MQIETRMSLERENLVLERMTPQYHSAGGVESIQHAQVWATITFPSPWALVCCAHDGVIGSQAILIPQRAGCRKFPAALAEYKCVNVCLTRRLPTQQALASSAWSGAVACLFGSVSLMRIEISHLGYTKSTFRFVTASLPWTWHMGISYI